MQKEKLVRERRSLEAKRDVVPGLPHVDDVISEWFSQDHPDRLKRTCWRDHSQYREYHKTL